MVGRLLIGCFLSAALAFLLLLSADSKVQAVTYKVNYTPFTLSCNGPDGVASTGDDTCTCVGGGAYVLDQCADLVTTFNIPATSWSPTNPDHSNFDRINTFHAPPEWGQGPSSASPIGSYAGLLYANSTLSVAGGACPANYNVIAPIPLYNCSTDNSVANQIAWTGDGTNLIADSDVDGIPDGCEKYPAHVDTIVEGRKPFLRLYGYETVVSGAPPTQINFVVFQPAQLTMDKNGAAVATSPDKDLGDSLGYSNQVIMDNPILPPTPSTITDFCTPLGTNTYLWATSGGEGVSIPAVGGAELGLACIKFQGTNQIQPDGANGGDTDGDTVADDGCWVVTDWCGDGVDNDGDTTVDEMCGDVVHRNPNTAIGGASSGLFATATHLIGVFTESYRDYDEDGFTNDVDACPYTYSVTTDNTNGCDGCPAGTCTSLDQDSDGYLNRQDRCPFAYDPGQIDNDGDYIGQACDTDSGTQTPPNGDQVPDGVYLNAKPRGAVCVGATDTDGDGWCDATEDIVAAEVLSDSSDQDSTPEYIALDYPVSSAVNPPGAAPGTCSDQTYYASAGDPNVGGIGYVDNDEDGAVNGADPNCAALTGDADQDGIPDGSDNCINAPNPEQLDIDGDTTGDACDTEDDGDGLSDYNEWKCGWAAKDACSPFDQNNDHTVNVLDILLYKAELGTPGSQPTFDANCDHTVNVLDILLYKGALGAGGTKCPFRYG